MGKSTSDLKVCLATAKYCKMNVVYTFNRCSTSRKLSPALKSSTIFFKYSLSDYFQLIRMHVFKTQKKKSCFLICSFPHSTLLCIQVQKMVENTETLVFQDCQSVRGLCLGQVCLLNYSACSTYRPFLNLPLPAGIISGFVRFWLYFLASLQQVITVCTRTTKKLKSLGWINDFL